MSILSSVHRWGRRTTVAAAGLHLVLATAAAPAQQRVLLPEGTVIPVRTADALSSRTANVGDTFQVVVSDSVRVEGFTVIPEGSVVDGAVTVVRRADRRQSGVIGVEFTRIQLPNGSAAAIDGKLTSTDPGERRQIDAQPGAQVLFVGGRRGAGAAIGAMNASSSGEIGSVLGALGTLLSEGADVEVPRNTALAVQLERGLAMRVMGTARRTVPDAFTIYTSQEAIRAAQTVLRDRGYYRGGVDGVLTEGTQRALVEFQIDNGIIVTGNLDGRTAAALGLSLSAPGTLSPEEATLLRRNAQALAVRYRDSIGIAANGRLNPRRAYSEGELEVYFALSAFADNASLFEQITRVSGNADGIEAAGTALAAAARRVDDVLRQTQVPTRVATGWGAIQEDVTQLQVGYPAGQ